jgi:hypothetical protein
MEQLPNKPLPSIEVENEVFSLFLVRDRGVALYTNADRSKYLRLGKPEEVQKELAFHKELLSQGFPVAPILKEDLDGATYWIEESLGAEHFGDRFQKETKKDGVVSDGSFHDFLAIIKTMQVAQAKTAHSGPENGNALKSLSHFERMRREVPDDHAKLTVFGKQIEQDLKDFPFCPTHGDFSAHNTVERGVIDFGDSFHGPLGYDLITAISAPFWFPKQKNQTINNKFMSGYDFTDEQVDAYLQTVGPCQTADGAFDIREKFDSLFFLRATNFWVVGNDFDRKLQAWRFERYRALMDRREKGESLYEFWREHRAE